MKIGIISDTHGSVESWNRAYNAFFFDADMILHAGDVLYHGPRNSLASGYAPKDLAAAMNDCKIPIFAVRGNCDSEVDMSVLEIPLASPYFFAYIDGIRLLMTHGHAFETLEAKKAVAQKLHSDIWISGHTHMAGIENHDGCIFLNPGSPALSKRLDGRQTIAVLDVLQKEIRIHDVYSKAILDSYMM